MKVRDLMTEQMACCLASDMASQAARVMMDLGVGGVVPIVDKKQESKLIGVVTDRELWLEIERRDSRNVRVCDCLITPDISCSPDDEVEQAVDCMCDHEVLRIPVIDEDHRIQGMVSMADVLHYSEVPAAKAFEALKKV
jgi:CBS domain-containing protein